MFSAVGYDNKEDMDKNIPKKEDMDKNIPKKEDMDKNMPKTNKNIPLYYHKKTYRNKKNGDWRRKKILLVFWDNKHIFELHEKWIYCDSNYVYF